MSRTEGGTKARARIVPQLGLFIAIIALDRITKTAVASGMRLYEKKVIVSDFFNLVHTRNTGIAFSLFADSSPLVKGVVIPVFSTAAVVGIAYLFWKSGTDRPSVRLALALILAGAGGNLYDRFAYGYVTDFLDFYVGSHHWPAFNVADSSITVGACALFLDAFRQQPSRPEKGAETA